MAFPSTDGTHRQLSEVLRAIRELAKQVKADSTSLRTRTAAGPVSCNAIISYVDTLAALKARMGVLAQAPGLAAYAATQFSEPGFDIAAEYAQMVAQIDATGSWIATNIPKDAGGRWLAAEELVNGVRVDRMLSSASTSGLRTQLDALIATID